MTTIINTTTNKKKTGKDMNITETENLMLTMEYWINEWNITMITNIPKKNDKWIVMSVKSKTKNPFVLVFLTLLTHCVSIDIILQIKHCFNRL